MKKKIPPHPVIPHTTLHQKSLLTTPQNHSTKHTLESSNDNNDDVEKEGPPAKKFRVKATDNSFYHDEDEVIFIEDKEGEDEQDHII